MPAMSPTMTEGNIAAWKLKEGDSFSAGDILLEIETDKAQMEVEAQEDGKIAKITESAGAKGVKVGSRIAIIAEADDDLSAIEMPADKSESKNKRQEDDGGRQERIQPAQKTQSVSSSQSTQSPNPTKDVRKVSDRTSPQKQTYPLLPSVAQLLHQNGLSSSDVDNIPASGPKGRLLKGDVLAYIGSIDAAYPAEQSARIKKMSKLDLSAIEPARMPNGRSKAEPMTATPSNGIKGEAHDTAEVSISVSLTSVIAVQKKIYESLGIELPLSTFIARAIELANDELPRTRATTEDLFNDILGLDSVSSIRTERGAFIPQITALPHASWSPAKAAQRSHPEQDIYDILTEKSQTSKSILDGSTTTRSNIAGSGPESVANVLKINTAKHKEKQAKIFLERMKTILQIEPGRLVL